MSTTRAPRLGGNCERTRIEPSYATFSTTPRRLIGPTSGLTNGYGGLVFKRSEICKRMERNRLERFPRPAPTVGSSKSARPVRADVERVAPHKHCSECGKEIGLKDEYSSKECEKAHKDRQAAKKRQLLLVYFGGVALFALAMLLLLSGGR